MPKVDKIPCPSPGCGTEIPVRGTKTGKPYVECPSCGFQGFARKAKSIALFGFGEPAPKEKEVTPTAGDRAPGVTPKKKSTVNLLDF